MENIDQIIQKIYLNRKDISLILDINTRRVDRNLSPANREKYNIVEEKIDSVSYYQLSTLEDWCRAKEFDFIKLSNISKWYLKLDSLSDYTKSCIQNSGYVHIDESTAEDNESIIILPPQTQDSGEAVHTHVHTSNTENTEGIKTQFSVKDSRTEDYIELLKDTNSDTKESVNKILKILESQSKTIADQNSTISELNRTVQNQQTLTLKLQEKIDLLLTIKSNNSTTVKETQDPPKRRKKFLGLF